MRYLTSMQRKRRFNVAEDYANSRKGPMVAKLTADKVSKDAKELEKLYALLRQTKAESERSKIQNRIDTILGNSPAGAKIVTRLYNNRKNAKEYVKNQQAADKNILLSMKQTHAKDTGTAHKKEVGKRKWDAYQKAKDTLQSASANKAKVSMTLTRAIADGVQAFNKTMNPAPTIDDLVKKYYNKDARAKSNAQTQKAINATKSRKKTGGK